MSRLRINIRRIYNFFTDKTKRESYIIKVSDRIFGLSDKEYIMRMFKARFGYEINLDNPKTFNEKNNWRKLYDRNPVYTNMVDKYMIKGMIQEKVGDEHTFELLGVWDKAEQIKFEELPNQFVLKVNHAGGVIVCRDKNSFNKKSAIRYLNHSLKINYFRLSREWPYKNVERKIICEKYMGERLTDYKNYCFDGKLAYTFVWENEPRGDGLKPEAYFCGAYDTDWERTSIEIDYPMRDKIVEKPKCYEDLCRIVEVMAEGIPFVRVDCYIINGQVYVGEMTFFPWGGFQKFIDPDWDKKLGEMIKLPEIEKNNISL